MSENCEQYLYDTHVVLIQPHKTTIILPHPWQDLEEKDVALSTALNAKQSR